MADTGLLISHAFDEKGLVDQEVYQKLMLDKLEVNAGMLVENMVAQMLRASGHKLYFYSRNSKDTEERMEIDFLIAKSKITTRHNISPIEVKSSSNYTIASLRKFIGKFATSLSVPYVVHSMDLEVKEGIVYLPLYMVPLL
jgi:predicted AAA+ superfamily ATPase